MRNCSIALVAAILGGCVEMAPPNGGSADERSRLTQAEIDSGDVTVPELLRQGRALVLRNWTLEDGFGSGPIESTLSVDRLPGPDSTSCVSCHGLGNGVVLGWGNNAANVLVALDDPENPTITGSNERNTPTEHGLVLLELLSKEMSLELRAQRDQAIAEASDSGADVAVDLETKGVSFGTIVASADGTVDTSTVDGVSEDLRVRPFHAKGHEATMRIFTRGALNRHHGIQATELLLFNDPDQDPETWDADNDGVVNEVTEGELTAMTVFQACLPIPQAVDQDAPRIASGRALMETIGCTGCHVPSLTLDDPTWRYVSSGGIELAINLTDSDLLGAGRPASHPDGSVTVELWADLKRHDLGTEAHEPLDQPVDMSKPNYESGVIAERVEESLAPIPRQLMLTTELWGVRDTGPWWHDGSSPTIEDAILRHGGDAQASRDAYAALTTDERADLLAFLNSLQVAQVGEVIVAGAVNKIAGSSGTEAPPALEHPAAAITGD